MILLPTEKLGVIKMFEEKFGRAQQYLAPPKVSTNYGKWYLHISTTIYSVAQTACIQRDVTLHVVVHEVLNFGHFGNRPVRREIR